MYSNLRLKVFDELARDSKLMQNLVACDNTSLMSLLYPGIQENIFLSRQKLDL